MTPPDLLSLTAIHAARVAQGRLSPDAGQDALLPPLDTLRLWLEAHPDLRRAHGIATLFARHPTPPPPGFYIWGGVGRGKSMLMDLFHERLDITAKRRMHFHAFLQEAHHGMHAARKQGVEDPLTPVAEAVIAKARVLCLDEMQITDITDAMIVGRLFEKLFAAGVVVLTTSNRPPEDLYKDGLNRAGFLPFIALLRAHLQVVELRGPTDHRDGVLRGAQVYFHPAAGARAPIDAIWAELTGGAAGTVLRLPVNGRTVEVPRFHAGVARASFWDLCARPLGPGDYLAIAAAVRVLILEDIPQLSAANYNEAKRFVTLVDALYEAGVKLVALADAAPEALYPAGDGAFEFERTVSRLQEMRSAAWLEQSEDQVREAPAS